MSSCGCVSVACNLSLWFVVCTALCAPLGGTRSAAHVPPTGVPVRRVSSVCHGVDRSSGRWASWKSLTLGREPILHSLKQHAVIPHQHLSLRVPHRLLRLCAAASLTTIRPISAQLARHMDPVSIDLTIARSASDIGHRAINRRATVADACIAYS